MWDALAAALDKETSPFFKNMFISLISFDPTSLIQSPILSQNRRNAIHVCKDKKNYHDQLVTVVSQSSTYKIDHKRIQ